MSALEENRSYGLSGGSLSRGGNVSVYHVKLTDSAARAIGAFQNSKGCSSRPSIGFNGNQGRIAVPCSDDGDQLRMFSFGVTDVARDNPHGSFDCVQQIGGGDAQELSCLGVIQRKMAVNATDDSYDKARQSMAQAEEETRSHAAIVIKHEGRYQGKKVTVRAPAPALAGLTKPRQSSRLLFSDAQTRVGASKLRKGACSLNRKKAEDVQKRPLRERVTHLLALRPYKRPELVLRLQKDGLPAAGRDELEAVLTEVGQLNSRDGTFVLRDALYKGLQKDWPGYTAGDQQLLKRILVRRLFRPQQNLLTVPEAQVSPLRDTPTSSPAHRPLPYLPDEYTDPLLSKKPRISRLSCKAAGDAPRARTSTVATREDAATASPLIVPDGNRRTTKRKKSKHKRRAQEKNPRRDRKARSKDPRSEDAISKSSLDGGEPGEMLLEANGPAQDAADYLLTYTPILSHDQRQSYKQDFNREYSEYRDLHAHIEGVTSQFMELDAQRKRLHHESHKYKTVHVKILQEYRKIKKSNPNYNQEKSRCEYLHNKLAHIKKLISQYDQRQLGQAREDAPGTRSGTEAGGLW
ncbi:RNA polymerase II elongation factor ELL-like [Brachionichthys hirsutus]|uniref:RNA polymerase II elongation factor ELL-like n=1 Tax=Brachionichthys hirsutus TaxID=412623 RepID=UPI003604DD4D